MVDADLDGLIEIDSLDKLNNIRYSLDGTSYKTSLDDAGVTTGCPGNVCKGYELVADLDFDTDGSERIDEDDAYWRDGEGWEPIPNGGSFSAIFEGNQHTIANLFIDERISNERINIGLFSTVTGGEIRNLGLVNANVTTNNRRAGALVGWLDGGEVTATYMTGRVINSSTDQANSATGGLIGRIGQRSTVTASYAVATLSAARLNIGGLVGSVEPDLFAANATIVANYTNIMVTGSGDSNVGGLIGNVESGGGIVAVTANYAIATISDGRRVRGLIGLVASGSSQIDITDNYFDATVSGLTDPPEQSTSTQALQMPTEAQGYTGIYANWDVDINGDNTADDPWHFGTSTQYPGLALPQIATTAAPSCPPPALAIIAVEMVGDQCIHRPLGGELAIPLLPVGNAVILKLRVFLESALP